MSDRRLSAVIERSRPKGHLGHVLWIGMFLAGAAAILSLLPKGEAADVGTGLVVLLAVVGIGSLLAIAAGFAKLPGQQPEPDVTRLLCDGSKDALIVTAADGKVVYANPAYLHWSRARAGDGPAGDGPWNVERLFAGRADVSEAIYRLAQAARDGRPHAEEIRMPGPGEAHGPISWYRIEVRPMPSTGASVWAITDTTSERGRSETIFQEHQDAIDFLDSAPAGFFTSDREGVVSFVNATLAAWLDYDLAEVGAGGLTLTDLTTDKGATRLAVTAGDPGEVRTEQIDLDLKRRGGQSLPARLLHRVAFGPDGMPGPSRTLVLQRPVAEAQTSDLGVAETGFAQIFRSTSMPVALLDEKGGISRSNAAFARLMPEALKTLEAGGGCSIYSAVQDRDRAALEAAIAAATRSVPDIEPVDVGLRGEGERSARLFVAACEDGAGNAAAIYALDTTELRRLQHDFAQAVKMNAIGQLAGNVAHDFNNLLTAIIGHADLLLANHRPTDPQFRDIMQIKQNSNRAAGLVRQLLAYSRRQTLRPQVLQLGDVLSDLQILMRRLVGEKIDLDLRHGRDLWLVEADLNQFEQVMINLIVNARDAMPDGGKILLRTRNIGAAECASFEDAALVPADYVAIEVEDSGHGIPAEVKDKIFEPFFTTKEVGKGTGLGLATVYGIVKQTGGFVLCASTPGQGTTFSVLLPRHIPEVRDAPPASDEERARSADLTGHGTILLVEDEEAVRAFGARALASRGYTVLQATSGIEALEIADANNAEIDLVVSDVVMPEMDGPTLLGELRKRGIAAKVVFVSGYAEGAFEKNLPEGEAFGFLPKPFSIKQLIEAVKAHMA